MRYNSDDALMAKCKDLDFSVESANCEKNLEILKGKLAKINEERCSMKGIKRIRKPIAILAAALAIMIMTAATLVASPALRDWAIRAVRHDDGSVTISVNTENVGSNNTGTIRVGEEEDGSFFIETECGIREIINVYDAADLCPDDSLVGDYAFSRRPDNALGLEAFISYTADLGDMFFYYYASNGFGYVEFDVYTIFYRMIDDYGIVNGSAMIETDGSIYFVAECGERTLIHRPNR